MSVVCFDIDLFNHTESPRKGKPIEVDWLCKERVHLSLRCFFLPETLEEPQTGRDARSRSPHKGAK